MPTHRIPVPDHGAPAHRFYVPILLGIATAAVVHALLSWSNQSVLDIARRALGVNRLTVLTFLAPVLGMGVGLFLSRTVIRHVRTRREMPALVTLADQSWIFAITTVALTTAIGVGRGPNVAPNFVRMISTYAPLLALSLAGCVVCFLLDQQLVQASSRSSRTRTAKAPMPGAIVHADTTTPPVDLLHRERIVRQLLVLLHDQAKSRQSSVVAVNGEWGVGKTTLLLMLKERLRVDDGYIVFWFDPWHFESAPAILRAFFDGLSRAVSERYLVPDLRLSVSQYVKALSPALSKSGFNPLTFAAPDVETLRDALSRLTSQIPPHIVIILDDLDRLEKSEILLVLQLIKLTAELDNITYLLALDRNYIETSLIGKDRPKYVDKFIDLDVYVGSLDADDITEFVVGELSRAGT